MTSPTRFRSRMSSAVKFDLTPLTRPPRQTIFLTRVPNKRFLLKNQEDNKCLKAQDGKVVGTNCSSPDLDMLWRWTGTKDKQLMNIRTLQCMQGSPRDGSVSLEKCQENSKFQKMTFISLSKGNQSQMTIGWARWGTSDRQIVSHRFLQLNSTNYAVAALGGSQIWKSTANAGCYRFSDGSFMKYVNYSEMSLEVQISAPTFQVNRVCEVEQNFQFIRDGEEWQTSNEGKIFSVSSIKELKIAKREHFEAWNGTLLKLSVKCGNNEPHCVLLKLQSLPGYNTKIRLATTPRLMTTSSKMTTISSKITTIAIAVPGCLLAVILVVTLIYFVCYRRPKRCARSKNSNTENPVTEENISPIVQELSEYAIPSNDSQPAPRQPQQHSIPDRDHEYQNDGTSGVPPHSPKYELPQNRKYEYPEQLPNHHYEYPDVRVVDGLYSPLVRPPLGKNGSENNGYTSLINGQISKEASATGTKDQADRLLYVDAMDGDYTPLVRPPLKNNEAPRYQPLLNYSKKTSEEASATGRKDEGNGLYDDVMDMNGDYTPLARPPLKDNENEIPRYEPLLNNGKGSEE